MSKKESRTGIRLEAEQRQKIDQLVEEGKFKNRSEIVRAALNDFLAESIST